MPDLIAQSPTMRPVVEMISRVEPSDANVLITGENGTAKFGCARDSRSVAARVANDDHRQYGGLSETLFESKLFGHVKGAFTDAKTDRAGRFELADEARCSWMRSQIYRLPTAKLLRVNETGDFERVGSSKNTFMPTCESSPLQRKSGK